MGRQQNFYQRQPEQPIGGIQIHPIWRGVGFLMLLIIPAMSYITTLVLLDANNKQGWFPIPAEFISPWVEPLLFVKIGMTIAISFVLYAISMLITFVIYRFFGPNRYGPFDAPPIKARVTKRSH
jgi:hypothetical protein